MTDCIVAAVSDIHSNSTIGICPYSFQLDDGGTYKASKAQRWLWRNWRDYWDRIADMRRDTGLPVVAILNGDLVDGNHHRTTQIITSNEADQLRLAVDVLQPVLDTADRLFIIRGTEAHAGQGAAREEAIARDVGAEESRWGTASWWHLYAEFGGVTFDVMHHGESGSMRPWTAGAGVNRIAAILVYEYARTGDAIPQVALRAHRHTFKDSGTSHPVRVFQTPPWQLTTAFGYRIGVGGKVADVGGLWFVCRKGEVTGWEAVTYRPKRAKPYKVAL